MVLAASTLQAQLTPPPAASQGNTENASVSHRAKEFLKDAAQIDQTEIAAANVALAKTQNTEVKDFAHLMINNHTANYDELQKVAQNSGVELSPTLSWENRHEVDKLQKASESDFDRDYATAMLRGHVKAIKKFEKATAEIKDPQVQQFAARTMPTLRTHLQHADQMARAVGVEPSTIKSILKELPSEDRAITAR